MCNGAKEPWGLFFSVLVSFVLIYLKKSSSVMHLLKIVIRWFFDNNDTAPPPCQLAHTFVRVLWLHLNNKKPILRNLFLCLSNGILDYWRHNPCFLFLWDYFAQWILLLRCFVFCFFSLSNMPIAIKFWFSEQHENVCLFKKTCINFKMTS